MNDIRDKFLALFLTIFLLAIYALEGFFMKTSDEFIKNLALMGMGAFIAMLKPRDSIQQQPTTSTEINSEKTTVVGSGTLNK